MNTQSLRNDQQLWRHAAVLSESLRTLGATLVVVLAALLPTAIQAQGAIEAWVQRHNGPANGEDYACSMALDASGNVYVTGNSLDGLSRVITTIKYSSTGLPIWTNQYNAATPYAVAVDHSGDVLVTGAALRSVGGDEYDCVTIKYSSAGVPLWTNRYSAPGRNGAGQAMTTDSEDNVYVTGQSHPPLIGGNYLTLKYSSAGVLLWAREYDGPANDYDRATAVAVDATSNVFVTGWSDGSASGLDFATIAYSSTGAGLWTNRYNGPGNAIDSAYDLALDAGGNVVVTGGSEGVSSGRDWATIKYSPTGVPMWTNRYNGPASGDDEATALAVDAGGNVLVTGWSAVAGGCDWLTIKYSSAGVPLWTNIFSGPGNFVDVPAAIALDASANAVVTGYSVGSDSGEDYATVAYSSTGLPLWTNLYRMPGGSLDEPYAVAVDASGNVYVTGKSEGSASGMDYATVKYVIPPFVTLQPLSRTNLLGTTASFYVEVAGSAPFIYQWRKDGADLANGGNLSGVTTTNLLIANVQLADAGDHTVLVTNAWGSATSVVARLRVTASTNPGRFRNVAYSPATGFSFVFCDATVGLPYRIQTSSSLEEGSWVDWQSFTYNKPIALTDLEATGAERRFYRAVSP